MNLTINLKTSTLLHQKQKFKLKQYNFSSQDTCTLLID